MMRILLGAVSNPVNDNNVNDSMFELWMANTAKLRLMVGLLKVASLVVGRKLLVGVQLGQIGRFGRLIARH